MTSAPTLLPSVVPSSAPVSSVPSSTPTITGAVVYLHLDKQVTEDLSQEELDDLVSYVEEELGIYPDNVEVDVVYEITGTIEVEGSYEDAEALEQELEEALATALGIHISDVDVTVNPETGEITYVITSESYDEASGLSDQLQLSEVNEAVLAEVSDAIPTISGVTLS